MNLINKKAPISLLDSINQLIRLSKAYWGYDETFLDEFMKIMGITEIYLEKNTANIIYLDEEIIGFYSFILNTDKSLVLDKFFLHPNHIGKGYGRKLWESCCETAKNLRKNEFTLWSDLNAEAFYLKVGCVKIGSRQSPIRPEYWPPILKYKII